MRSQFNELFHFRMESDGRGVRKQCELRSIDDTCLKIEMADHIICIHYYEKEKIELSDN